MVEGFGDRGSVGHDSSTHAGVEELRESDPIGGRI
jgi:hypothetical protein